MNINIMNRYITIFIFLLAGSSCFGQQEALYTQFVYNKLDINPGYAGYKEVLNFTALHRSQWIGFKGAPTTQSLSFNTPLQVDELAVGGSITHDKIGPTNELELSFDFAYRLRLTNRATLSFGMKATAGLFQANFTDLDLISDYYGQQDEFFQYNPKSVLLPNIGFGMFYYEKDYFLGLSVPKMLRNSLTRSENELHSVLKGNTEPTAYLMGGKVFKLNREWKILPAAIIKGTKNAPMSFAVHANVVYMDQMMVGLFYNFQEVAGGLIQWQLNRQWKLGYSFDLPISSLIRTSSGSHELMLNCTIATRKKRIVYPRIF
jgi:type IX secretion system PorP/SprF family membrane protein